MHGYVQACMHIISNKYTTADACCVICCSLLWSVGLAVVGLGSHGQGQFWDSHNMDELWDVKILIATLGFHA